MRRILFLDIDGVLNSKDWYIKRGIPEDEPRERDEWYLYQIDPEPVLRLNKILDATDAKVVVSSTWRLIHTLENIDKYLRHKGFTGEIIGKTPRLNKYRGHEIQAWMDNNLRLDSFVIIDDDSDMVHLSDRHVKTPFETGLLDEHVEKAIELLLTDI